MLRLSVLLLSLVMSNAIMAEEDRREATHEEVVEAHIKLFQAIAIVEERLTKLEKKVDQIVKNNEVK